MRKFGVRREDFSNPLHGTKVGFHCCLHGSHYGFIIFHYGSMTAAHSLVIMLPVMVPSRFHVGSMIVFLMLSMMVPLNSIIALKFSRPAAQLALLLGEPFPDKV